MRLQGFADLAAQRHISVYVCTFQAVEQWGPKHSLSSYVISIWLFPAAACIILATGQQGLCRSLPCSPACRLGGRDESRPSTDPQRSGLILSSRWHRVTLRDTVIQALCA